MSHMRSSFKSTQIRNMCMVVVCAYIYVCTCMIKGSSRFYCLQLLENIDLKFGFKSLFRNYFEIGLRGYSITGSLGHQSWLKQRTPFQFNYCKNCKMSHTTLSTWRSVQIPKRVTNALQIHRRGRGDGLVGWIVFRLNLLFNAIREYDNKLARF